MNTQQCSYCGRSFGVEETHDCPDNYDKRIQTLCDALDHIAKTCMRAERSTTRLEWIAQRAREAIAGMPYDRRDHKLPKSRVRIVDELEAERDELRTKLERLHNLVVGWREHDWPEGFDRHTAEVIARALRADLPPRADRV